MKASVRDPSLDTLLHLDGETFVVDSRGMCWVKFEVKQCGITAERPQGLRYSLTLHDETGARLMGFDNAHPIREGSGPGARVRASNMTTNIVAPKFVSMSMKTPRNC